MASAIKPAQVKELMQHYTPGEHWLHVQRQLPNGDFQLRYTVKAPTARVADDVDVLVRADSAYTAEVAIYSRTRITTVDLGKNKARVEKLVADLTAELGEPLP